MFQVTKQFPDQAHLARAPLRHHQCINSIPHALDERREIYLPIEEPVSLVPVCSCLPECNRDPPNNLDGNNIVGIEGMSRAMRNGWHHGIFLASYRLPVQPDDRSTAYSFIVSSRSSAAMPILRALDKTRCKQPIPDNLSATHSKMRLAENPRFSTKHKMHHALAIEERTTVAVWLPEANRGNSVRRMAILRQKPDRAVRRLAHVAHPAGFWKLELRRLAEAAFGVEARDVVKLQRTKRKCAPPIRATVFPSISSCRMAQLRDPNRIPVAPVPPLKNLHRSSRPSSGDRRQ